MGQVSVLNVGAGDISVTFNSLDEAEGRKAVRMLTDMVRRGYAVCLQLPDGTYQRVTEVDAAHGRYVVQIPEADPLPDGMAEEPERTRRRGKAARKTRSVSQPISQGKAVGIARSAGG